LKVSGLPNPRLSRFCAAKRPNSIRRVFSGCSVNENARANCSSVMPNCSATAFFISDIDGDGMQVSKSRHMPFWLLAFFLFTSPALAGTVTWAGKTYKDVVYAKFTSSGYFGIVPTPPCSLRPDWARATSPTFASPVMRAAERPKPPR
jgi:hypothetical protein